MAVGQCLCVGDGYTSNFVERELVPKRFWPISLAPGATTRQTQRKQASYVPLFRSDLVGSSCRQAAQNRARFRVSDRSSPLHFTTSFWWVFASSQPYCFQFLVKDFSFKFPVETTSAAQNRFPLELPRRRLC